jgi:hypothetical protein
MDLLPIMIVVDFEDKLSSDWMSGCTICILNKTSVPIIKSKGGFRGETSSPLRGIA